MTVAISKAVQEGATAVICASTGNTSASAAAYAVKAGLDCVVLVPHGRIAAGQARPGAGPRRPAAAGRGRLRRLPAAGPRARRPLPGVAGQLGQRLPHRGPEDGGVRGRRRASAAPPTSTACRWATPATSRRTGRATSSTPRTGCCAQPRMWGFQAAGAAPLVRGEPVDRPRHGRDRDPDRRPGVVGRRRRCARRLQGPHRRGHRRADPRRAAAAVGAARASSSSRPARRRWPGCCSATSRARSTPGSWSSAR